MADKKRPRQNLNQTTKKNWRIGVLLLVVVLIAIIPLLRPGVYTIQPVDAMPEGVTIIYLFRPTGEPFFTSLHPECYYSPTSVSLICNAMVRTKFEELSGKILWRLPYNHWAYLKGSDGVEPGNSDEEF